MKTTYGRSPPTEPTAQTVRPQGAQRNALLGQIVEIFIEHKLKIRNHESNHHWKRQIKRKSSKGQ